MVHIFLTLQFSLFSRVLKRFTLFEEIVSSLRLFQNEIDLIENEFNFILIIWGFQSLHKLSDNFKEVFLGLKLKILALAFCFIKIVRNFIFILSQRRAKPAHSVIQMLEWHISFNKIFYHF